MAKAKIIKRNTDWQRIADDVIEGDDNLFEGLTGVEVLTDYELVSKKRGGKKDDLKRNRKDIDGDNSDDNPDEIQIQTCRKKKKKQKLVTRTEVGTLEHNQISNGVDMSAWDGMFLPEPVKRALESLNYTSPTTIQMFTLPSAIRDRLDIVGAAETGSGKTLAFGIPLVHRILQFKEEQTESTDLDTKSSTCETNVLLNSRLYALVLTPTRELAVQIKNHLRSICKFTDIKIAVVVGGMATEKQERLLGRCPEIIVATPGRLWELIQQKNPYLLTVTELPLLVIDEADRLLEKGHFTELAHLLELINGDEKKVKDRQNFVFSATLSIVHDIPNRMWMKKKKRKLTANDKLSDLMSVIGVRERPKIIDITRKFGTAELLQEARIDCANSEKDLYLYYFLTRHPGRTLVFFNSIDCVRRVNSIFTLLERNPVCLHASMHQKQRLKNLEKFTAYENGLLLATDVAARGLDIPNIKHVVHYQVPRTSESYIHRSGRTARASREGLSVMLIDPGEKLTFTKLCRTLNRNELLPSFPVDRSILKELKNAVMVARNLDTKLHRSKRAKNETNWLKKAAEEMDVELDDEHLLNNFADDFEQSKQKSEIKNLEKELKKILKKVIIPRQFSFRYPTMSGKLPNLNVEANESAISLVKKETQEFHTPKENSQRKKKNKFLKRKKIKT